MSAVLFQIKQQVAWLTLHRPEKYNSFNRDMALQLQALLKECASNDEVRCICIIGSGKAFCAGQDLSEFPDPTHIDFDSVVSEYYNPLILQIRQIEKPVVAAVNGVAAGAGANLSLACDITVATESASFMQAFSKIGLIPDSGGTFFLPRLIGWQKATALMMLADKVSASEAAAMGMIYKMVADAQFLEEIERITTILAAMPTIGLGLTKRALNESLHHDLPQQLLLEKQLQTAAGATQDFEEGVNAFLEKRKAVFTGK